MCCYSATFGSFNRGSELLKEKSLQPIYPPPVLLAIVNIYWLITFSISENVLSSRHPLPESAVVTWYVSCPILERSLKIGSYMRKRFIWRLDQKCNMFIHEVGQRSSTNITLGAYCISNQIKEQKIYSEFVDSDRSSLHCYAPSTNLLL